MTDCKSLFCKRQYHIQLQIFVLKPIFTIVNVYYTYSVIGLYTVSIRRLYGGSDRMYQTNAKYRCDTHGRGTNDQRGPNATLHVSTIDLYGKGRYREGP